MEKPPENNNTEEQEPKRQTWGPEGGPHERFMWAPVVRVPEEEPIWMPPHPVWGDGSAGDSSPDGTRKRDLY